MTLKQGAENGSYQRAAEENLPAEGHGKVAGNRLKPGRNKFDSWILENQSSPETHGWTHQTYGDAGSGHSDHQRMIFSGSHGTKGNLRSQPVHETESHDKADGKHDGHLF